MSGAEHVNVVIIGAGPAGLAAAIELGQRGVPGVVLTDRAEFPRDKTCGSAISPKGIATLHLLGVHGAIAAHGYPIRGLRLVTPQGRSLDLVGHTDAAMICCRRTFDHLLLQRALALGIRFVPRFHASWLIQRGDRVGGVRSADGREFQARFTVVADGAHSRFGLERGPKRMIQAIMGWWEGVPFRSHQIDMVFDDGLKPYYGWLFPEGPDRVNIGICYADPKLEKNARQLLSGFLDRHYRDKLAGARQVGGLKGHPILWCDDVRRLASPGRFVIGEAGRMTHPATAEGIYQGMSSGLFAAAAIAGVLDGREDETAAMAAYQARCRRAFGTSFRASGAWRRFVSAGGLDIVARGIKLPPLERMLARGMAHM